MRTQTNARQWLGGTRKAKALAAGLLAAALMAAGLLLPPTAPQARAADTFTVDRTIDTPDANIGDGDCDVSPAATGFQCTLRAAIQEANATLEPDLIRFSILDGTSGVKTINVGSSGFGALPTITNPVTVDGYTQPGSSPNTKPVGNDAVLKVELSGASTQSSSTGLEITATNGGSVIKGLAINRFSEGIDIHGDTVGNRIEGNFIGTDPTGTIDKGNTDDGVNVFGGASENVVGGTTPAARNVISGNTCEAVFVNGANKNKIQGNYVGTDKTGTKRLTNGDGSICGALVINNSSGNTVGGTTAGARNVVSGNSFDGVEISGTSHDNQVLGNRIGTTASGTGALGNGEAGVSIRGSSAGGNLVGDGTSAGSNTIAFNAEDGVLVGGVAATGNTISRNSIFSNAGLGIDLHGGFEDAAGNTANDPGDIDSGPNGLQNKPVITSAKTSSTKTTITGKLASGPNTTYTIEFYSNPSGNEGKKFLGQKLVTTDASGNAAFTFSPGATVSVGQTVTATATAQVVTLASTSDGDTSEFSAPKTVALSSGSALSPETTKLAGPSGVTKNPTAHFKFSSPDPEVTFECSLDGGAYYPCSSPENVERLSEGRHTFSVRAVEAEGNPDQSPAVWIWAVERNNG